MPHPLDETLAYLLSPMTVEQFRREFWGRKAVSIPGSAGKFARYYDEARWYADPPREATAAYPVDEDGVRVSKEVPVDPSQLPDMYDAGLATMGHVGHVSEVADLLDDLRASLQVPTRGREFADTALCFRSKDDAGWSGHWDVYHVFVLQIAGAKRWRYSPLPLVPSPDVPPAPGTQVGVFDGQAVMRPHDDRLREVLLEEGDFFYMPPGTWHAPRAQGHSCHLALAIGQLSVLDLLLDALREQLIGRAEWRAGVPAVAAESRASGAIPAELAELFAQRLAALGGELASLDARVVHQRWAASTALHTLPAPLQPGGAVQAGERLGTLMRAPLRYVVGPSPLDPGQSEVFLYSGQAVASLPHSALNFVKALAVRQDFIAREAEGWDPDFGWDEVQAALTALVDQGMLRRL